jgi:hypothetical protein
MTTTRTPRLVAAALLGVNALIHAVEAPEYLEEEAYIGVLFIGFVLASILIIARLAQRDDDAAWMAGAAISVLAGIAFILSRTVGLPSFKEDEWEGLGILCLLLEAGFVVTWLTARGRARSAALAHGGAPGTTVR